MTRKNVAAMRRTERERRHRIRTGGLVAREHVEHEREVVDARHPSILRGEALMAQLATSPTTYQRLLRDAALKSARAGVTEQPWALASCPKCGATGDEPCRKPNGRVADAAHKMRAK